jgi:hypothetical protein
MSNAMGEIRWVSRVARWLVVATAQILHERVPGGQDLGEPVQELVEA